MLKKVTQNEFIEMISDDHFTTNGKKALYDYLNDANNGKYIIDEVDIISNYTQFENWQEFKNEYEEVSRQIENNVVQNGVNEFQACLNQLRHFTIVVYIGEHDFIIENF